MLVLFDMIFLIAELRYLTGVDLDLEIGAFFATALPDGQASMKINKNSSVVRMEQGVIEKDLYLGPKIRSVILQGSHLFVFHENGTIVQMQPEDGHVLNVFNTSLYRPRNYASQHTDLCDIDSDDVLFTTEREVYTYNISSDSMKPHVKNLGGSVSVSPGCLDGNVVYVVTERGPSMVHVYNATWSLMTSFGGRGTDNGQLDGPFSAVMSDEGYIFVSDYFNSRVSMFTSDGQFLKHIIIYEGQDKPWSLSVRGKYLWVSTQNGRLTRFIL